MTEQEKRNRIVEIEKQIKVLKQLVINQGLRKLPDDHPIHKLNQEMKNLKLEINVFEEVSRPTSPKASFGLFLPETVSIGSSTTQEPKRCHDRR